ncbi:hypothetical protein BGX33_010004 [Mortierella sp. NVP41]|nr:hypothetical protein BGX33_010004 [Mortierella sp. NVP41]
MMIPRFSTLMTVLALGLACVSSISAAPVLSKRQAQSSADITIFRLRTAAQGRCPSDIDADDFDSKAERATFLSTILFNTNYLAIMQPGTNLVSRRGSVFMLTEVQAQSYFKSNAWLLQASKSFQSPGKPMSAREVNGGGHGIFGSAWCTLYGTPECTEVAVRLVDGLEVTGAFRQWANGCIGATDQTIGERTQLFNRVYEALP